jgi:AcrR family transcriptional regulator
MSADPIQSRPPRWRRRKQARPAEIVSAALDVFAERGFAAATLDEVAARAGISKGTLYLYFPNKDALFRAMVRETVLPNIAAAESLLPASPGADAVPPAPALIGAVIRMMATRIAGTRAAAVPRLIIAEARNFPDLARFYMDEVIARGFALMRAILERGIAAGEIRPVDVEETSRCIVAPVLFAALWKSALEPVGGKPLDLDALCRAHLDLLLLGLTPRGETTGDRP